MSVTEEDLNEFSEGDYVDVELIDDERIVPEARGITLRCCILSIGWEFKDGTPGGDDKLILRGRPVGEQVLSRDVDRYVINADDIEDITAVRL